VVGLAVTVGDRSVGVTAGAAIVVGGHRVRVTTVMRRGDGGILGSRRITSGCGMARGSATAVVTVTATATVSVRRMGSSVVAALGRLPVVPPRVTRLGRGYVVELLTGIVGACRPVRGGADIGDWGGLGG